MRLLIAGVSVPLSAIHVVRPVSLLMQVDVGNFLRLTACVLYTERENPAEPLINVEVVAHVTRPELRSSEVSIGFPLI